MLIEVACGFIFGVDQHGTDTGYIGCLENTAHRIGYEGSPETLAVPIGINRKARQDNNRHRMAGNAFL